MVGTREHIVGNVPSGVTSVSVVAVGAGGKGSADGGPGGGGGGGGLGWNNITVSAGSQYTVVVGDIATQAGGNGGDSYFIDVPLQFVDLVVLVMED